MKAAPIWDNGGVNSLSEIVQFLRARLDEDEWWAREASRLREQEGQPAGDHWQWEEGDGDRVLSLDPAQSEYVGAEHGSVRVSLRSRELYPTAHVGDLPNFAISAAEEVPTTVGGHIVRHDPARVLADVDAKRRQIELCEYMAGWSDVHNSRVSEHEMASMRIASEQMLLLLAAPYADHPECRDEWRP